VLRLTCCTQSQAAAARTEVQCSRSQKVLAEERRHWVLLSTLAVADLEDNSFIFIPQYSEFSQQHSCSLPVDISMFNKSLLTRFWVLSSQDKYFPTKPQDDRVYG